MDPGSIGALIPVAAIVAYAAIKITRIQAGGRGGATDREVTSRLTALEEEVGGLRQELVEAQERLDFTERLLAQQPRAERVEPPH
jgi:hypothetical protein